MSTEHFNHGLSLIAQHWPESKEQLTFSGHKIADLVPLESGPTFIYDAKIMRQQYEALKAAVGDFAAIYYSVKANPRVEIIGIFNALGAGAEIASVGEYRAARQAAIDPSRIIFAGPGKRQSELEEVIASGVGEIHIESFEEITRLGAIGTPIKASLRINPIAEAQGGAMRMGGKPTAFGFDEDQMDTVVAAVSRHANINVVGVHVYGGTQILDAGTLVTQWKHSLAIAAKLGAFLGRPLETIDLGGGLGIPYFDRDRPLDLEAIACAIPALTQAKSDDEMTRNARVIIEPGRFLVGPSGVYVAEVNSVKQSHGSTFVICEGGMHHHLAASGNLGQVVKRNYPIIAPAQLNQTHDESVNLVGPLCTPLDTLGRNVALPRLKAGDLIAVLQSGAYGLSASPTGFLSHPNAREILVDGDRVVNL